MLRRLVLVLAAAAAVGGPAAAQWGETPGGQRKGEGALVVRDGATGWKEKSGSAVKRTFRRGDAVAGFHKEFLATVYEFFEEDGRVRVLFPKGPDTALLDDAWMDPADLEPFVYDCCDAECIPVKASFKRAEWNPCFREAMQRARAALPGARAAAPAAPAPRAAPRPGEKPLTNDDVVAMVKADLGDEVVVSKIAQAPEEALDVSTDALVKLRKQGVPKAVLDAMVRRAGRR